MSDEERAFMTQETTFRRVGLEFARNLLGRGEALVLDVRDEGSFERGHIEGAARATEANLYELLSGTPKDKPILIYCYHGNSSQVFAKTFADFHFSQVFSLDGGYEAWAQAQRDPAQETPAAPRSDALQAFLVAQAFPLDDVNGVGAQGLTPLMQAAYRGSPRLVAELLQVGARVDVGNNDGNQPLWLACVGDDPEIVALLIAAGADLDHKNVNGSTALMYAASAGKARALKVLLDAGADLDYQVDGFSALDMAASLECLNLMREAKRRRTKS
jgi:ankyrin repeat protein